MKNTLYYGDNLAILREHIASESVDLIYLDPPFNSNRSYNVLFKQEGKEAEAQIKAFDDTWHWSAAAGTYDELVRHGPPAVSQLMGSFYQFIGPSQMMAYLVMMAVRLVELHRVLKPTGSLYLHCDPTASHYLKIVLDTIFGTQNFENEIIWKRYGAHSNSKGYGVVHDVILYYAKGRPVTFNRQFQQYEDGYVAERFRFQDADGRRWSEQNLANPARRPNLMYPYTASNGITYQCPPNGWKYTLERMKQLDKEGRLHFPKRPDGRLRLKNYLDELPGLPVQDVWTDISLVGGSSPERLGYPTQKPLTLLERIIQASSNPGDVVLDPFAGCGTAIVAAQQLGRQWIGIDITHLSIALLKYRLKDTFDLEPKKDYAVRGEPQDYASARQLAEDDRYQFQWWALSLIEARPLGAQADSKEGKKGADRGIDGVITFIDDTTGKPKRVLVQVKSGHVNSATIRDLRGVIERDGGAIGALITLEAPSQPMLTEAAAGFYHTPHWGSFPKLQILTIEGLMHGTQRLLMPAQAQTATTFKQAEKEKSDRPEQPGLGLK